MPPVDPPDSETTSSDASSDSAESSEGKPVFRSYFELLEDKYEGDSGSGAKDGKDRGGSKGGAGAKTSGGRPKSDAAARRRSGDRAPGGGRRKEGRQWLLAMLFLLALGVAFIYVVSQNPIGLWPTETAPESDAPGASSSSSPSSSSPSSASPSSSSPSSSSPSGNVPGSGAPDSENPGSDLASGDDPPASEGPPSAAGTGTEASASPFTDSRQPGTAAPPGAASSEDGTEVEGVLPGDSEGLELADSAPELGVSTPVDAAAASPNAPGLAVEDGAERSDSPRPGASAGALEPGDRVDASESASERGTGESGIADAIVAEAGAATGASTGPPQDRSVQSAGTSSAEGDPPQTLTNRNPPPTAPPSAPVDSDEAVAPASTEFERPRKVFAPQPGYPDAARERSEAGTVTVTGKITAEGDVREAKVVSGVSQALDRAALEAFSTWQFIPAKRGGTPVESAYRVTFRFQLDPNARPAAELPDPSAPLPFGGDFTPPERRVTPLPSYPQEARASGASGDIVLGIIVEADGAVSSVEVLQGLSEKLDQVAVDAVRQWRFRAATRAGESVRVEHRVTLRFVP